MRCAMCSWLRMIGVAAVVTAAGIAPLALVSGCDSATEREQAADAYRLDAAASAAGGSSLAGSSGVLTLGGGGVASLSAELNGVAVDLEGIWTLDDAQLALNLGPEGSESRLFTGTLEDGVARVSMEIAGFDALDLTFVRSSEGGDR